MPNHDLITVFSSEITERKSPRFEAGAVGLLAHTNTHKTALSRSVQGGGPWYSTPISILPRLP